MEKRGGQAHREDKTSADEKTGWPEANGIFRGAMAYSTGHAPSPERDRREARSAREQRGWTGA